MLTFICYPKCSTCQKAKVLLDSYHAQYEIRDIKTDNPNYDELKAWLALSGSPVKKFFNTSGLLYKSLGLKDKMPSMSEDECLKLLATDGMLVKRPLLVDEYRALVGFHPHEWESVFEYNRKKTDKIFNDYFNEMLELVKRREEEELARLEEIADKSPNKIRVVNTPGGKVAVQKFDVPIFNDSDIVLGHAAHIERIHGCRDIAVSKEIFEENFFDLSSGFIEETAQKLADSGFRLAVVGDFSGYANKPLQDFICESNRGGHLYFVADEEEALEKLGDCRPARGM
jgi:arsenate reductase